MIKKWFFWGIVVAVIVVAVVVIAIKSPSSTVQKSPSGASRVPSIVVDPSSATYAVDGQPITIVNGNGKAAVAGSAPIITGTTTAIVFTEPASGDLNGDGKADEAVILMRNFSGKTSYYVAAAINGSKGLEGTNALLLSFPDAPAGVAIKNKEIVVSYNPGEPKATPPALYVMKYFSWNGSQLQPASTTTP